MTRLTECHHSFRCPIFPPPPIPPPPPLILLLLLLHSFFSSSSHSSPPPPPPPLILLLLLHSSSSSSSTHPPPSPPPPNMTTNSLYVMVYSIKLYITSNNLKLLFFSQLHFFVFGQNVVWVQKWIKTANRLLYLQLDTELPGCHSTKLT